MSDKPGRQQLSGYVMRDYDEIRSSLYRTWNDSGRTLGDVAAEIGCAFQHVSVSLRGVNEMRGTRLFDLVHALGYDLALIPRDGSDEVHPDPINALRDELVEMRAALSKAADEQCGCLGGLLAEWRA